MHCARKCLAANLLCVSRLYLQIYFVQSVLTSPPEKYFVEPEPLRCLAHFSATLRQINVTIRARNAIRGVRYEHLLPESIPLSQCCHSLYLPHELILISAATHCVCSLSLYQSVSAATH